MTWKKVARRARVPLGLVFTTLFLVLARPTWASLWAGLPFVLLGLWLRGYAAGTLRKNTELATTGPYARTRNPLYLGSGLMVLGFAIVSTQWYDFVVFAALFYAVYYPTILSEEERLRGRYAGFEEYMRAVPRIVPRLLPAKLGKDVGGGFAWPVYVKNREYQALMGSAAMYAVLVARVVFYSQH